MKNSLYYFLCLYFSLSFAGTVSKRDSHQQRGIKTAKKSSSDKTPFNKAIKDAEVKNDKPKYDLDTFKKMLDILDREDISSEEYKRAARDLETSYYHNASFETLELLSETYREKGDEQNQIKVLERLKSEYPDNPKSHYLLGRIHKKKYEKAMELNKDLCQIRYNKSRDKRHKQSAIEEFTLAIEKDSKYEPAYMELLPLLRELERWRDSPRGGQQKKAGKTKKKATKTKKGASTTRMEVLSLAKDMVRHFRKPEYYVDLCEAYYQNDFSRQARKACRIAIKKNPNNPRSHLYHALAQPPDKVESHLIKIANQFPESELIQLHAGRWFLDKTSDLAVKYFASVVTINPKHSEAHAHLAKLLFKSKQFEKAHNSFKTACFLNLRYIQDFRKAKQRLYYAEEEGKRLIPQFEQSIDECFTHYKKTKSCS